MKLNELINQLHVKLEEYKDNLNVYLYISNTLQMANQLQVNGGEHTLPYQNSIKSIENILGMLGNR